MVRYRCPVCGVEADIDRAARSINIVVQIPAPAKGQRLLIAGFPLHRDCELARPIDSIDTGKLEVVS